MIRKVIKIDEDKCIGCGACANACHEGAIGIVDGKAKLLRDDYCDGLGNCLPNCPVNAISFESREAAAYNKGMAPKRVEARKKNIVREGSVDSKLSHWPVQIKLVPTNAPYFHKSDLLIAADCSAFAYGNFHEDFIKNRVCIIGCPKLDDIDYSEKLQAIFEENDIKSITIVRMEVPCCGGIEYAAKEALRRSDKVIRHDVITISTDGNIIG